MRSSIAAIIAIAICSGFNASAQATGDTITKTTRLEPIDVRTPRAEEHSPITHTTILPAQLRQIHVGQDAQYVLERAVPSVVAYSESGTGMTNYGSFRLRGMDQTRVNVTIDGVPLNDMIDQGVFFSNISDLTNGMASVQVQRGIGMSMNGTASYAGSVNFETSSGEGQPLAHAEFGIGSFNMRRASAMMATGTLEGGFHAQARFTTLGSDGYRFNTASATSSFSFSGGWTGAKDAIRVLGLWGRTSNQLGYFSVPASIARSAPRTNINDVTDHDDFGQQLLQVRYTRKFSPSTSMTASAYYGGAGGDYFSGFRDTASVLTQINYPLSNRHIGVLANITSEGLMDGLQVTGGIHAYTFMRRNWETVSPENESPYYDDRTTKEELSLFARATYAVNDWQYFADVQARTVSMSFMQDVPNIESARNLPVHRWLFANPRLGVRYLLGASSDVYLSLGQTGREPTRFDLLGSTQISDANVAVLRNPNTVRAEYALNAELGYRTSATNGGMSINAFFMRFRDEIAPIGPYIEQQFVQLRKNVAGSHRLGVEIEGWYKPLTNLRIDGNVTWMSARIDAFTPDNVVPAVTYTNVMPILTPHLIGNVALSYTPFDAISVDLAARGMSRSFADISNDAGATLPAFMQLDARAWWKVTSAIRVGLHANNVTNAFVVTNGGSVLVEGKLQASYFVQAGRNYMITMTMDF